MADDSHLVLDTARVPDTSIFFLGCHNARVTVLSQQRRALNLIDAILASGIVRPNGRIAIIGGGIAGLTAGAGLAVAAKRLKAIDLYESQDRLLHLQEHSDRHLHPHIYDWPAPHSTNSDAGLPILNWKAGAAREVASQILTQFNEIKRRSKNFAVFTPRSITSVQPRGRNGCQVTVKDAPAEGGIYDAAIIAIGYGYEREVSGENQSYWSPSRLLGPLPAAPRPVLFISGNGDGGLVDFLMASFNSKYHEEIVLFLTKYPKLGPVKKALLAIEERAWERPPGHFDIFTEYRQLPLPDHLLLDVFEHLRPNAQIWLHTREPQLFRRDTALLNRFAAFLAISADQRFRSPLIEVRIGRQFLSDPLKGPIDIGDTIVPTYRFLRFGAARIENMEPFKTLSKAYKDNQPPDPVGYRPATPALNENTVRTFVLSRPTRRRGRRDADDLSGSFLEQFAKEVNLSERELLILRSAGVRKYEDVVDFVEAFPSIAERFSEISRIAATRSVAASPGLDSRRRSIVVEQGAAVADASWPIGSSAPLIESEAPSRANFADATRIDLRKPFWPVRDQGARGTTVAFAVTAAAELEGSSESSPPPALSEQFLYWAIKTATADPNPTMDGTTLAFAREAIAKIGICEAVLWPYVGTMIPGNVTHATASEPSASAKSNAIRNRFRSAQYLAFGQRTGRAAEVLAALERGSPVAITIPVFRDPHFTTGPTNWTTPVGRTYGRVLNPPPRSVVVGGHAVCVVGFVPDPSEPLGGYFIARNSWGTTWASNAPHPEATYSPEPGYGELSASYVDNYIWEMLCLGPGPAAASE
jgi:hypothetical protein